MPYKATPKGLFLLTLAYTLMLGGAAGVMATLIWMCFDEPDSFGRFDVAPLLLAPIAVPFGVLYSLPMTIIPTTILGALLSLSKHLTLFKPVVIRMLVGVLLGGGLGYAILAKQIELWGSAAPGLLIGAAIGAAWPLLEDYWAKDLEDE